jgi:hypothetical protein
LKAVGPTEQQGQQGLPHEPARQIEAVDDCTEAVGGAVESIKSEHAARLGCHVEFNIVQRGSTMPDGQRATFALRAFAYDHHVCLVSASASPTHRSGWDFGTIDTRHSQVVPEIGSQRMTPQKSTASEREDSEPKRRKESHAQETRHTVL